MDDSTITTKGQVTIPKHVRDRLGVKAGDRVTFTVLPDGVVLMRPKIGSIRKLGGMLCEHGREPVPTDQLSW